MGNGHSPVVVSLFDHHMVLEKLVQRIPTSHGVIRCHDQVALQFMHMTEAASVDIYKALSFEQ